MENIILTNNKDLRLVSVKVGVLSTLRFELPLVSASATRVEVIVTSGNVHSAYTATFVDSTKRWQCDIAASQFPAVGKQSYEIAYVLDGKQFWDGKGWIEIEDATTSGIEPQPRPEPYRYAVVSVNGYGADAQGAVRIPKTVISTSSPTTTDGFMEGDIYFNRLTCAMWTLCDVQDTLTWVFNYSNYYTKAETDEQIDKLAAYYITSDVQGNPFATRAALLDALAYYSGGELRVPTRNDYAVVLADESHGGAEWRYIYTVAAGSTTGQWEAQYPVEGVITYDNAVTKDSGNGVKSSGIWSMIWGALAALPTGSASLYDWVVAALAGKASTADATLTPVYSDNPTFSDWTVSGQPSGWSVDISWSEVGNSWVCEITDGTESASTSQDSGERSQNAVSVSFVLELGPGHYTIIATRTRTDILGYVLGSQTDKPLASEAEAEALRQGKQDALTTQQLANIAAVPDKLDSISAAPAWVSGTAYTANALVTYDGVVYRCKANTVSPHTATPDADTTHWEAKPVSELFLPLTGGTATGVVTAKRFEVPNGAEGGLRLHYSNYNATIYYHGATGVYIGVKQGSSGTYYIYFQDKGGTLALAAPNPTAGNLAALDANGNPTDSQIPAVNVAVKGEIPYILVTQPIVNNAVLLEDRASNAVTISATLSPNTLTINFPTATSGKVRDFAMHLNIAAGVTAPEIAWPQGVTLENDGGEVPEIADGGTGGSSTILYFSETENNGTTAKFLVKGETLTAIAQV